MKAGEPLFVVDIDKAELEVEAAEDGILSEIRALDGSSVLPLDVVGVLDDRRTVKGGARLMEHTSHHAERPGKSWMSLKGWHPWRRVSQTASSRQRASHHRGVVRQRIRRRSAGDDFLKIADRLFQQVRPFSHMRNNNPNTEAHALSAMFGTSLVLPVAGGKMRLGTYQRILLFELDGPKTRTVSLTHVRSRAG